MENKPAYNNASKKVLWIGLICFIAFFSLLSWLGKSSSDPNVMIAQAEPTNAIKQIDRSFMEEPFKLTLTSYVDSTDNGVRTVTLDVTYENVSNTAQSSLLYNVVLKDDKGREFMKNGPLSTLAFVALNPGLTESGKMVYELPADADIKAVYVKEKLAWKINE
ncbi:DUF4352 domain-containing protein [Paenibacillus sp. CFBP13512]|uniref:DUF4352 domain-containing protein n=1 Tax=Paenibacillus sp. CFBP13512 TaxID=2184007 RepID=UPI0013758C81|nr:DUF4352 domain-containing protein [Paenibacillus sp. CFBP13512]